MSRVTAWPFPCDVHLGVVVRSDADLSARLHRYTLDRNMAEMEKLLKKGVDVDVDSINHLGQTALFYAALLGHTALTKLMLQYGADPNHRCADGSTAVHAAVFSCKPWLLGALLDAGGDLRLHDLDGRTPQDWLTTAPEQHRARMVDFLHSLTFQVHQRLLSPVMKEHFHRSNSISRFFKSRGWDLNRLLGSKSSMSNQVPCRGFGKMCVDKPCQVLGMSAPIPVIVDSELTLDDDEAPFSFSCGSFISMTKCMWKDSRVTVKELRAIPTSYLDLLLIEQDYCCQLPHPLLLQLVAVNLSDDLHRTRLVFERVHVGSLYNLLHRYQQPEFPTAQAEDLLWTAVQVCEGLMFLHSGGLVMRALSSHSVMLTRPGLAKLTGLGFMVPSKETCARTPVYLALPPSLYYWAAPEVIQQKPCTWKADLYSLCAIIQEIYTDMVPWGLAEPRCIKDLVDGGHALDPHWKVPQPHYDLIKMGLQPRAQGRTLILQDLYDTLHSHSKVCRLLISSLSDGNLKLPQEARQNSVLRAKPGYAVGASGFSPQHCATNTGVLSLALPPVVVETDSETEAESGEDTDKTARIRANLNVSRELLQQARRSLDTVEKCLQTDRQGGTHDIFIFPAVGPPSQYRLQPQGHPAVKKMDVQLLSGEFTLLDQEELSFWLTQYPAEQNPFQESSSSPDHLSDRDADSSSSEFTSEGADSGSQELICDSLLLRDKWTVTDPGRHSRGPERRQRSQSPCDQQPKPQPRHCVSPDEACVEEQPETQTATWTNYISDLVARMTGCKMPGSSDGEEVDHNMQAACESNQKLLGCRDHNRKPSTDPHTKRTTEDESGTDSEDSSVGENESELDADFHTVDESFSQTCRVWDEEACPQRNFRSEEEAADVTLEVCGPAASRTTPNGDTLDSNNNEECVAVKNCEETHTDGAISAALASFPLTENIPRTLPELAELSSITCSPAHLQDGLQSPVNRMPPLYNSTPRSPAHHQRGSVEVIPYPGSSTDSSSCGHSTAGAVTFATASTIFASASSAPQAPPIKAGPASKPPAVPPAGQGDTYTIVPPAGQGDTCTAVPPVGQGDTCTTVPPVGEGETYTTALLAVEGDQQESKEQRDKRKEESEEGMQGRPHREAHALQDEYDEDMDQVLCPDEDFGDKVSPDEGDCDLHPEEKWPALGVGSAEGASLLEDTARAQSTLDEVLQHVQMEGDQTSPELTGLTKQREHTMDGITLDKVSASQED